MGNRQDDVCKVMAIRALKGYQRNVSRCAYLKAKLAEIDSGKGISTRSDEPDRSFDSIWREYKQLSSRIKSLLEMIEMLDGDEQQVIQYLISNASEDVVRAELGLSHRKLLVIRKRAIDHLVELCERCFPITVA